MYNPFKFSNNNKRFHAWDFYLKNKYHSKIGRVSLNANLACPNRDGTIGVGGCTFCRQGSSDSFESLEVQYVNQLRQLKTKWNTKKHFVYFQAFTNTYAPVPILKENFEPFIGRKNAVGLIIGTRADCLGSEIINYLADLNKRTDLWIELGLQSSNDATAKKINRCHDFETFKAGVKKLRRQGIKVAVHTINGLPGETKEDMIKTINDVNSLDIQALKIHMLSIVKDTSLATSAMDMLTQDEYINIVVKQLELVDENIIIQRLTGDPDRSVLIKPDWITDKSSILNGIDKLQVLNNTWQGKLVNKQQSPSVIYAKKLMDRYSNKKYVVVDATLGNGFDTEFLAKRNNKIISFDVQDLAIVRSSERLKEYKNFELIKDSHHNILNHIKKFNLVVFNTGYLPGSKKITTTNGHTTNVAIRNSLKGLVQNGFIILTIYKGHDDGHEYRTIVEFLKNEKIHFKEKIIEKSKYAPSIITIKK